MENEEMLEQTSEAENVETQTTEENEEGIELTDTSEGVEEDKETIETEENKEVKKSLREILESDESYQQEFSDMIKGRLDRQERKFQKELSKYRDTDNVLRTTLNLNEDDDVNSKVREFYENEGVKLPEPIKAGLSTREIERLGIGDAEDIIVDGYEAMEEEANRLARIGYQNLNERERVCFNKLAETLTNEKNKRELLTLGAKEELLSDKDFIKFRNQFNLNTPIKDIYSLYKNSQPKPKVDNPGSMKNTPSKTEKDFISEEEYDKMSREEVRKNMALIEKSMSKW